MTNNKTETREAREKRLERLARARGIFGHHASQKLRDAAEDAYRASEDHRRTCR